MITPVSAPAVSTPRDDHGRLETDGHFIGHKDGMWDGKSTNDDLNAEGGLDRKKMHALIQSLPEINSRVSHYDFDTMTFTGGNMNSQERLIRASHSEGRCDHEKV